MTKSFLAFAFFVLVHLQSFSQSLTPVERIVQLADSLKSALTSAQIAQLQLNYSYTNAQSWSNLPVSFIPRLGIPMSALNANQKAIAYRLMEVVTGTLINEGYDEIDQLFKADEYLAANGGGSSYGRNLYYLCFNGTPSLDGLFSIKIGGHHLQVENTYNKGVMVGATPHFIALEPLSFSLNGQTFTPMQQERAAFAAMLAGLSTTQLNQAKLTSTFGDILLGAKNMGSSKDWQFPSSKSGLLVSTLTTTQKALVLDAIETYVLDIDDENATAILNQYTKELDDTYIAYAGNINLQNQNDYVRIDGPTVWIEFSVQRGIVLSGVHYHSIWRDHLRDYGGAGSMQGVYETAIGALSTATLQVEAENIQTLAVPNPVEHYTNFSIYIPQRTVLEITIHNLEGKLIEQVVKETLSSGNYNFMLDFSRIAAGLYLLKVQTTYGSEVIKVEKF